MVILTPRDVACWPANALLRHLCHYAGHRFKPRLTRVSCLGAVWLHLEVMVAAAGLTPCHANTRTSELPILPVIKKKLKTIMVVLTFENICYI